MLSFPTSLLGFKSKTPLKFGHEFNAPYGTCGQGFSEIESIYDGYQAEL